MVPASRRRDDPVRENPPKKYEDIYPLDFETKDRDGLWRAARGRPVLGRPGRPDLPRGQPAHEAVRFWEWLIGEVKAPPDVLFLGGLHRPRVMYRLAAWGSTSPTRTSPGDTKSELHGYLTELTQDAVRGTSGRTSGPTPPTSCGSPPDGVSGRRSTSAWYWRPSGANYGIYGPRSSLESSLGGARKITGTPRSTSSARTACTEIMPRLIAQVNRIRRDHPALQPIGRSVPSGRQRQMIAYTKDAPRRRRRSGRDVNLDPHHSRAGWTYACRIDGWDQPLPGARPPGRSLLLVRRAQLLELRRPTPLLPAHILFGRGPSRYATELRRAEVATYGR